MPSKDESHLSDQKSDKGRGWHGDPEGHAKAGRHSHDNDNPSENE
jgi:hypothetical protein